MDTENTELLNIRPKTSIYRTFSRYNYSVRYALAEFVDNSTASFYSNQRSFSFYGIKDVEIRIYLSASNKRLVIKDNAHGMDLNDFKRALLLDARPEDRSGRNEFGMGLKTAACWFGKKRTVESTKLGSPIKYRATIDVDELEKTEEENIPIFKSNADPKEHGTIVTIENLIRIPSHKTLTKIKNYLSSMYRKDIKSGYVKIYFNDELITFRDYEVLVVEGEEFSKALDFSFDFQGVEHHITGKVGILGNNDSGYKKSGFALFRRNRGVIGAEGEYYKPQEIYGQAQSHIALRLFGELNLDDFEINQAKDGFVWDDGLEDAFVNSLKSQISDYIQIAMLLPQTKIVSKNHLTDEKINKIHDDIEKSFDINSSKNSVEEKRQIDPDKYSGDAKKFVETINAAEDSGEFNFEKENSYNIPLNQFGDKISITVERINNNDNMVFKFDDTNNKITLNLNHPLFRNFIENDVFIALINKFVIAIYLAKMDTISSAVDDEGRSVAATFSYNINERLKELKD